MKIAKKVLALAIAVVMVASLSAMAFAATPTDATAFKLTLADASDAGYTYAVILSVENGVGFKAGGVYIKYDPAVLVYAEDNGAGADAAAMGKLIKTSNAFYYETNAETEGVIDVGFYFKENLWTTEQFLAEKKNNAKEDDVKAIDVNSFELVAFYFDLADGAKEADIAVALEAKDASFVGDDGSDIAYNEIKCIGIEKKVEEETTAKKEEETTAKKEEATTKAPVTPEEKTTAKGNTGANKPTGDTGLLAIAAGVVAVAGAAFVVTKKRK